MSAPSRRLVLGGGALTVFFALSASARRDAAPPQAGQGAPLDKVPGLPGDLAKTPRLDAWIRIEADGGARVFTGKAELGQGIKTALLQVAAGALDLPLDRLVLVTADTGETPDEGITAGSHTLQDSGSAIRAAAADVRWRLIEAAAGRWRVAPQALATGVGAVIAPDGRRLAYGELVAGLDLAVEARPGMPLPPDQRRVIGVDVPRVDIPAKLTGDPAYVQDLRLPGMVHARIVRGPSEGTLIASPDVAVARAQPGVIAVVSDGRFLAVVADEEWRAVSAQQQLRRAGWSRAGQPLPTDPQAFLRFAPAKSQTLLDRRAAGSPAPTHQASYSRPYLMHGAIGPSCAVALLDAGGLTVWTHSQGVFPLRGAIAQLVRLPIERVRCIQLEGSGCYGHDGADDVAGDAAVIAMRLPGRPVRLQWMREDEHGWEPLGPAMLTELAAALGPDGRIAAWRHAVWSTPHNTRPKEAGRLLAGQEIVPPFTPPPPQPIPMPEGGGDRNAIPLYALPSARVDYHFVADMPLRVSALRSLGAHMNVFSIESFMDELALAAGADPISFRLRHLDDPRAAEVIAAAARRFGWSAWRRSPGRGRGFGFARYKNLAAWCAVALEVSVEPATKQISIGRVVGAVDAGEAVNPDGVRNQIEGAIVQSTSWTLLEQVAYDARRRTSFDWSAYPILRFAALPASVEVEVIDRPGTPFLGVGECGQGPTAAALANALFDATGVRLRDLPLTPEKLKAATA